MSVKKKKGQSPWSVCDYCNVTIAHKDVMVHKEKSCPPNLEILVHPFILNDQLNSNLCAYQSQDKALEFIPKENKNDYVIMPIHVLQLCKMPVGDPVMIKTVRNTSCSPIIKLAWATQDKTSELSAALSGEVMDLYNISLKSEVIISKIEEKILPAKEILVTCDISNSFEILNFLRRVKNQNIGKIYCVGNKILLRHYGNKILFQILKIIPFTKKEDCKENDLYLITYETKFEIRDTMKGNEESKNKRAKLGGLDTTISELKDIISICLNEINVLPGIQIPKGILIHGPPGTGKTMLIETLAEYFTHNIVKIECSKIFSKFLGETEKELQKSFEKAIQLNPSIILIDDLDVLCGKSTTTSELEKRISATLSLLMDRLNSEKKIKVVVLATSSKIDQIEKILRSPNRFGKEVEIYVPTSTQRFEILKVLLSEVNHNLSEFDIKNIAESSHGFVGADLASLVSKAVLKNYKSTQGTEKVSLNDFNWALTKVKPSALKEILIEVPNVRWNDIGGQDELKLKLRQCVEWPLKYSDAFKKLGITPPKGVLMFGPPGCSKTMIAKALATESRLNFISVKGPELFSKWVGESEKAVRKLFRRARQTAPSIIFFDELDAIGGERNITSGSNVQERVLAQLLTELDGVESLDNVTVIAATNRLDRIDPALIRPGRLDRIIYVPLPDSKTRQEIFALQLAKTNVSNDVLIEDLVQKTEGYSGAEIIAICREAALKALEENIDAECVMKKHFLEAFTIVVPRTPKSLLDMYDKYLSKH